MNILNNGQYLLPSSMDGFIMMREPLICKVYTNTEEEELTSKKALHSYGSVIGYLEDSECFKYLVEPLECRIHINDVDKFLEGFNVTWTDSVTEFVDEKPDNIRMIEDKKKKK